MEVLHLDGAETPKISVLFVLCNVNTQMKRTCNGDKTLTVILTHTVASKEREYHSIFPSRTDIIMVYLSQYDTLMSNIVTMN